MTIRPLAIAALTLLAACHAAAPEDSPEPDNGPLVGWTDARSIDREAVLLSSWRPTAPQRCMVATTPAVLPPVDSLLATDAVPALLEQGGIAVTRGSALVSLKFDTTGAVARVRVIESTIPDDAVPILEQVVLSALQPQSAPQPWGVRLRIDLDSQPRFRVGRAEKCPPARIPTVGPAASTSAAPQGAAVAQRQVGKSRHSIRFAVTVDPTGHVAEARALTNAGDDMAEYLRDLVLRDRYLPGLDDRVPVTMTVERVQKLTFVLVVPSQ